VRQRSPKRKLEGQSEGDRRREPQVEATTKPVKQRPQGQLEGDERREPRAKKRVEKGTDS
jgi:hypothetical protein